MPRPLFTFQLNHQDLLAQFGRSEKLVSDAPHLPLGWGTEYSGRLRTGLWAILTGPHPGLLHGWGLAGLSYVLCPSVLPSRSVNGVAVQALVSSLAHGKSQEELSSTLMQ